MFEDIQRILCVDFTFWLHKATTSFYIPIVNIPAKADVNKESSCPPKYNPVSILSGASLQNYGTQPPSWEQETYGVPHLLWYSAIGFWLSDHNYTSGYCMLLLQDILNRQAQKVDVNLSLSCFCKLRLVHPAIGSPEISSSHIYHIINFCVYPSRLLKFRNNCPYQYEGS